jgi:hypothetical protein
LGYGEFLKAIADPKHVRHTELTEWTGADFDPNVANTEEAVVAKARRHTSYLTCGPGRRVTELRHPTGLAVAEGPKLRQGSYFPPFLEARRRPRRHSSR